MSVKTRAFLKTLFSPRYKLKAEDMDNFADSVVFKAEDIATALALGVVKVGDRLSITAEGLLSADDQSYTLPTASASVKGGVKIGDNISIDEEGKISASAGSSFKTLAFSITVDSESGIQTTEIKNDIGDVVWTVEAGEEGPIGAIVGTFDEGVLDSYTVFSILPYGTTGKYDHYLGFSKSSNTIRLTVNDYFNTRNFIIYFFPI